MVIFKERFVIKLVNLCRTSTQHGWRPDSTLREMCLEGPQKLRRPRGIIPYLLLNNPATHCHTDIFCPVHLSLKWRCQLKATKKNTFAEYETLNGTVENSVDQETWFHCSYQERICDYHLSPCQSSDNAINFSNHCPHYQKQIMWHVRSQWRT